MDETLGVVLDGKIIVEGESLPEGCKVGVFVPSDDEPPCAVVFALQGAGVPLLDCRDGSCSDTVAGDRC